MDVVCEVDGAVGALILDRPSALNALDLQMIKALRHGFDAFVADPRVTTIVIRSAGQSAFCAGGDVRGIRDLVLRGEHDVVASFFEEEYALNAAIAGCPKPYIALIDGVCFGGGLGLSVHGRYRVVTERARLAMPETAIGFFPDVGASFFLPRLPGACGLWLGLTGARLDGAEAVAIGLATHYVPAARLADLQAALCCNEGEVCALLDAFAVTRPSAAFENHRPEIDALFSADTVPEILAALDASGSPFANEALTTLARMSPNSLRVTATLLARGRTASLDACLATERAAAVVATRHPDFVEGIRAALVDKDRHPQWQA